MLRVPDILASLVFRFRNTLAIPPPPHCPTFKIETISIAQVLFELCRFRNHHPAFNGEFELLDTVPDIKESTVLLPPTAYSPAPTSPVPGVTPVASMDNMTEGPPGASGSFAAQTVSLLASLDDDGNQDFLADVVLERSSIDVLASVDVGDADDTTKW